MLVETSIYDPQNLTENRGNLFESVLPENID